MTADLLTPDEFDTLARELGLELAPTEYTCALPCCERCLHPGARRIYIGAEWHDTHGVCEDPVACYTRQFAREVRLAQEARGRRQTPIGRATRSPYVGRRRR